MESLVEAFVPTTVGKYRFPANGANAPTILETSLTYPRLTLVYMSNFWIESRAFSMQQIPFDKQSEQTKEWRIIPHSFNLYLKSASLLQRNLCIVDTSGPALIPFSEVCFGALKSVPRFFVLRPTYRESTNMFNEKVHNKLFWNIINAHLQRLQYRSTPLLFSTCWQLECVEPVRTLVEFFFRQARALTYYA